MASPVTSDGVPDAVAALLDPSSALRATMGISVVGVVLTRRRDGTILYVNDTFARMLGRPADGLIGRVSSELDLYVDPQDRVTILRMIAASGVWQRDVALRHGAGHVVHVRVHGCVTDVGGEPCLLGFFEDVTALLQMESARRAREAEVSTMFEVAPVGLQVVDVRDQRYLRVNAAMAELTGYSVEELRQLRTRDLTHPDDRAANDALFAALDRGELTHGRLDKRYVCKDGSQRWVHIYFRVIQEDLGVPRRLSAVVLDTTPARADEAERRLLTEALHAADNGIVITGIDGAIRWINDAWCRLTGYDAEEVIGRNPRLLKSGAQPPAFYREMWTTIAAGETWRGELINRRKDGSLYHEEMTITPVRADGGEVTHFIAIKQDVTARKRVEQARTDAEERYRLALEASELGTWHHSTADGIYHLDERAQAHFGLPATATADDVMAVTHPDDRARLAASMMRRFSTPGVGDGIERRVIHPDGELRWIAVRASVTFTGEGEARRPAFAIGTSRDVTDSKRAAEALRASEDRYRNLIANLHDLVYSIDTAGRFTFVSPAAARFGYLPEEMIGRPIADFVHPDDRAAMLESFRERLQRPSAIASEFRWLDANGKVRIMRATARPLVVDGEVVGVTGLGTDITAQRQTEDQLRQAQRMEAIGRLAGGVAHDFNNLLGVIVAYTELVRADVRPGDPMYEDLGEIAAAAERAAGLTRQLLAFSRRQVLQPEAVGLDSLLAGMANMLRRLIGEDIQLLIDSPTRLHLTRVDRGQLEQVVMNLAVNARDAMPSGGALRITLRDVQLDDGAAELELTPGAYVELAIADTGTGMTPEVAARIFEPFFTTKGVGKGTGLGLSTVHGIVKQSGGGIAVDTAPGRGATFRIYLPALADSESSEITGTFAVDGAHLRGHERILVVEDEAALRSVTRRLLSAAGYQVDVAANAGEALLICEDHGRELDLVLTDVVMPGMSGRKLAERLASLCPTAKVMFMSGYTDEMLAQHDVLQHAFIRKPFDRATLAAKVRSVLDGVP